MKEEQETVAFEGKHLRVKVCGRWEYVERCKAAAGVVIVATTQENKLLLVEQYRIPAGKRVIELPAGLSGDSEKYHGEEFLVAARRELREETGYEAGNWQELTSPGPPSAGLSNEMAVFYRAWNLRKVCPEGGEEGEEITLHEVPLAEVESWLAKKRDAGALIDPKIYAGLYFVLKAH
jgi:ADP-ribose pyrophosphatase